MEEEIRVENFIISKEIVKEYFDNRLIISKENFLDYKNIQYEKIV